MFHFVWLLPLILALVVVVEFLRTSRRSPKEWPVYRMPLLSETERSFFTRLVAAVPEYHVFPQVQVCRFVEVRNVQRRGAILSRYARLSADFVVCGQDFNVLLVVELDDASHNSSTRRARDAKKDAVLSAAGIAVIRCHVRSMPTTARIREQLLKKLGAADQAVEGSNDAVGTDGKISRDARLRTRA